MSKKQVIQSDEPSDLPPDQPAADAPIVKVNVLYGYQGDPSDNQWIAPGVYAADDPRLCGLADYLIENGHARTTSE